MELWQIFLPALLFSLACNLDTILLAMGFAADGTRLGFREELVLAAVTSAVTWASLALGSVAAALFSTTAAEVLGGLVLVGIGAWFLLDALRKLGEDAPPHPPARRDLRHVAALAGALAVNNAGAGVAAGVSGLDPLWGAVFNLVITLLALCMGRWLGTGWLGRLLGRYALPLSGALLIILGLCEILF